MERLTLLEESTVTNQSAKDEAKRSTMISVRLTPDEAEELRREANSAGESLSEFVRKILVKRSDSLNPEMFPSSSTAVSGMALEARLGEFIPVSRDPYVSTFGSPRA